MKKRIVLTQLLLSLALSSPLVAAETDDQQKSEPERSSNLSLNAVKDFLGLSFVIQASYLYNFENPTDQENTFRVFDHKANSFVLDLAEIQLLRKPPKGGVGYKLKITAGESAKFIHSRGLGEGDDFIDLTEAYVDYVVPVGSGITVRLGKFATYHGAELLEAKDNVNYSYSFLFTYAIPINHTGLMVSYTFGELISVGFHVVNGWDNTLDNNRAKTFGLSLGVFPSQYWSATVNCMAGPEQDRNDSDWRFLIDVIITAKPISHLTVTVNGDYGRDTIQGNDVSWHGANLIVKYDPISWLGVGMRLGYVNDRNGVRTLVVQELKELVVTTEFRLPMNLILRPEYRHDWSSKASFHNNKSQDTLGVGMMYSW